MAYIFPNVKCICKYRNDTITILLQYQHLYFYLIYSNNITLPQNYLIGTQ